MSYLPGDRPFGSGSFSSDNIIAAAKALPEKKFNDAYARGYMDYKDHVETDYADNYIGAGAKVRLFRSAGQPFLHWSIEPDRMSFAQRGDVFYAGVRARPPDGRPQGEPRPRKDRGDPRPADAGAVQVQ